MCFEGTHIGYVHKVGVRRYADISIEAGIIAHRDGERGAATLIPW